jgi:hypothetical protein
MYNIIDMITRTFEETVGVAMLRRTSRRAQWTLFSAAARSTQIVVRAQVAFGKAQWNRIGLYTAAVHVANETQTIQIAPIESIGVVAGCHSTSLIVHWTKRVLPVQTNVRHILVQRKDQVVSNVLTMEERIHWHGVIGKWIEIVNKSPGWTPVRSAILRLDGIDNTEPI